MATWITHLMIADRILEQIPALHRRGFCVGSIAPDCNQENADWTAFTPPREVTHWMCGDKKRLSDSDGFVRAHIVPCDCHALSDERYAFLLGYHAHLVADAAFQQFLRDEARVAASWKRIHDVPSLHALTLGAPETFDSIKQRIGKQRLLQEIDAIEAEYLRRTPDSGYLTEILPLTDFPDYLDYLPRGGIVRKIGVMGYMPAAPHRAFDPVLLTQEEYAQYVSDAVRLVLENWNELRLL